MRSHRATGRVRWKLASATTVFLVAALGIAPSAAAGGSLALTLSATVGPDGATTILVEAPGCEPTPPGTFDITVQIQGHTGDGSPGTIGEGAVAVGRIDAPGVGSVVIAPAPPSAVVPFEGFNYVLTVACNGGTLKASQAFVLAEPATSVNGLPRFTG